MEHSVRCYLFDEDDRILLVKHAADQPWVLPWGHLENDETIYECLEREIQEELWVSMSILGAQNQLSSHHVSPMPLPISIHTVAYEHRERWPVSKLEYFFFARTSEEITELETNEIYDTTWVEIDELLEMETWLEIHEFIQEILEQNIDLLELL